MELVVSSGSEEGSYGKPVLLLHAAMCSQPSGLFSILQMWVKDPDWGLNVLFTSKQNIRHEKLSLQLISKSWLGSKGPPVPVGRSRLLIPETAKSHCGPASGHRLGFCPPVTSERSDGAGERKSSYAQKWEGRKLLLQFLLNWDQKGGSAWGQLLLPGARCWFGVRCRLGHGEYLSNGREAE